MNTIELAGDLLRITSQSPAEAIDELDSTRSVVEQRGIKECVFFVPNQQPTQLWNMSYFLNERVNLTGKSNTVTTLGDAALFPSAQGESGDCKWC